jgi:hypothetical protein
VAWEDNVWNIYDDQAEKLGELGGLGQGPGEYMSGLIGGFDGRHIFIHDTMRFSVIFYDLDGNYLSDHYHPDLRTILRTDGGWVSLNRRYGRENDAHIYWFDRDLNQQETLHTWRQSWMSPDVVHRKRLGSGAFNNPAKEQVSHHISPDRKLLFLQYSGPRLAISVFDVTTRRHIRRIMREEVKPVPFNEEWGRHQVGLANKSYPAQQMKLKSPENFPLVRQMTVLDNRIVLTLWTYYPDQGDRYLVLDYEGKDAELDFHPHHARWVLARQNGFVYFSGMDDGQAVIHKIPEDRFAEFADQHPVAWRPNLYFTLDLNPG